MKALEIRYKDYTIVVIDGYSVYYDLGKLDKAGIKDRDLVGHYATFDSAIINLSHDIVKRGEQRDYDLLEFVEQYQKIFNEMKQHLGEKLTGK